MTKYTFAIISLLSLFSPIPTMAIHQSTGANGTIYDCFGPCDTRDELLSNNPFGIQFPDVPYDISSVIQANFELNKDPNAALDGSDFPNDLLSSIKNFDITITRSTKNYFVNTLNSTLFKENFLHVTEGNFETTQIYTGYITFDISNIDSDFSFYSTKTFLRFDFDYDPLSFGNSGFYEGATTISFLNSSGEILATTAQPVPLPAALPIFASTLGFIFLRIRKSKI